MNCIYRAEKLPLMAAILIHGGVLYAGYLVTYRLNHWLQAGWMPLLVFTVIFVVGYFIVWAVIYTVTKQATCRLNHSLRQKQNIQKA